ncbi:hypothetical protein ACRAWF_37585 [Streptomyces sp. L7]
MLTGAHGREENTILPLAAEHLSVAEWEELGEISLAKLDKKHLLRAFSALMAVATPEEQRTLLTKAPGPPPASSGACPASPAPASPGRGGPSARGPRGLSVWGRCPCGVAYKCSMLRERQRRIRGSPVLWMP